MKPDVRNIIILSAVCALVFANTLWNSFMWDDRGLLEMISAKEYRQHLANPVFFLTPSYWKDYSKLHDTDPYVPFTPLRTLSLSADLGVWGAKPAGFHLTNILLHAANTGLLYWLGLILFGKLAGGNGPSPRTLAFFGALLFAVHPMHTESVAWIKNRLDLIMGVFYFLSVIFFAKALNAGKTYLLFAASLAAFALSLLAKEVAVTLPAVLALYVISFAGKEGLKKGLLMTAPFWALSGVYVATTQFMLKKGFAIPAVHQIDWYSNALLVFKTTAYYLKLLVFPFTFNAEREIAIPNFLIEPATLASVLITGAAVYGSYLLWKKAKEAGFLAFWFFITFSPVSNVIFLAPRPIAEQRLYLPSAGFCLLLCWALFKLPELAALAGIGMKPAAVPYIMLAAAGLFSALSINRNFDWRNEMTFWAKTVNSSPDSPRAWLNYGNAFFAQNDLEQAKEKYERSLAAAPGYPPAHRAFGFYYFKTGDMQKAIEHFKQAGDIE